jgi:hypothetical protein
MSRRDTKNGLLVYLTDGLHEALRELAHVRRTSKRALVLEAIVKMIETAPELQADGGAK